MKIAWFCIPAHGHTNPTLGLVKALTDAGSKIWVNSIWGSLCGNNDDERAYKSQEDADHYYGRLISLGFKAFQTDRPEYLIGYLRKKGLHD